MSLISGTTSEPSECGAVFHPDEGWAGALHFTVCSSRPFNVGRQREMQTLFTSPKTRCN